MVKNISLAGNKFMLEMHLKNQDLHIALVDHLTKIIKKERIKNLKKLETQDIFIKISKIKLVFTIIWLKI